MIVNNELQQKIKLENFKKKFVNYTNTSKYKVLCLLTTFLLFISFYFFTIIFNGISFETNPDNWLKYQSLIRTSSAAIVGFGLAVAGCGMQGVTRNDLSGPTTMGLLPAATFGIMVSQALGLNQVYSIFIFGILFCSIVLLINFMTTKIKGYKSNNFKTILVGLILGALLTSLGILLKTIFPIITESIVMWIGSTSSTYTWERFSYAAPSILIGIFLIVLVQNKLNIIEKDVSLAISLGINIKLVYWIVGVACILISISSILLLGSVVIIGIVIPHICRMLLKTRDYKWLIPTSGFLTAFILEFAMLMNVMFQLGITLFTVVIFVPIFIFLAVRKKGGEK